MSNAIDAAMEILADKDTSSLSGTAKFVVEGEGSIFMDSNGFRPGDDDADVTLTADPETFMAILKGELAAPAAFMSGKMQMDGDMGLAMALGGVL